MSQRGYVLLRKMARRVKEGKDWTTTSIQQYYTVSRPRQKMSLFSLVVTHVVNRKFKWLGPFLALLYTMSVVVGPLKDKRNRTEPNRTEPAYRSVFRSVSWSVSRSVSRRNQPNGQHFKGLDGHALTYVGTM